MPRTKRDIFTQKSFSERLEDALENNPNAPPKFHGERVWLSEQMEKKGKPASPETIRKWISGLAMPTHDKVPVLAAILGVDADWLLYGNSVASGRSDRVKHDAYAEAATNLVAGMVELDGASAIFPAETKGAGNIHLHAIIDRVSFPLHIALGEVKGKEVEFLIPSKLDDAIAVGVVKREGEHAYDIYEIDSEHMASSEIRSGKLVVRAKPGSLRKIESFKERF